MQLLEDRLEKLRGEGNEEERDNEAAWQGWELESDSSEDSDSEGWMNVDSDSEGNLEISDSEDEKEMFMKDGEQEPDHTSDRISTLATTKVCGEPFHPDDLSDSVTDSHPC